METGRKYTAVITKDDGWYVGWIEEVSGVNCQERDMETLVETLKITLKDILELNRRDAIAFAGEGYKEIEIAVPA